jgi:hypothetical protein
MYVVQQNYRKAALRCIAGHISGAAAALHIKQKHCQILYEGDRWLLADSKTATDQQAWLLVHSGTQSVMSKQKHFQLSMQVKYECS